LNTDILTIVVDAIVRRYGTVTYAYRGYVHTTTSRVWLHRLNCQGNERNIAQCGHNGWGVVSSSICNSHSYDTVVKCLPGTQKCVWLRVKTVKWRPNFPNRY